MTTLASRCRAMLRTGNSVDEVLALMRREGLSRIASISLLVELTAMSLRDAKKVVHGSRVWEDVREQGESFHEQLEHTVEKSRNQKPPED